MLLREAMTMKQKLYVLFLCLGFLAATLVAQRTQATLGEPADSVVTDRKALSAARSSSTVYRNFTVQQVESDAVIVREYVSPSGIVFGVAWNGMTHPDLTQLLGSYFSEYQTARKQTPRQPGHRAGQVKTDRVIVETWGHMRNLQGRAYAPALIPSGVSIDEIK
jgi:hypothetical protein